MTTPRLYSLLAILLSLIGCGAKDDAGSFSLTFSWDQAPEDTVQVWARVEHRPDLAAPGTTLSSAGPVAFTPGAPVALTLPGVSNGDDRVVVVEVREADDVNLPVLWYGLSEAFSIRPGEHAEVEVPLGLQLPDTAATVAAAPVSLELRGEAAEAVTREDAAQVMVVTRSVGAVALNLANDASFSAHLRSYDLASGEGIECADEVDAEDPAITWQVCRVEGWDLLAGLPDLGDGLYGVFVTFIDKNGYPSPVLRDTLRLDSTPPVVLRATLTPRVARAGAPVQIAVSFHEPLHAAPELPHQLLGAPAQGLPWTGPEPVPGTNTWLWRASAPANLDGQRFTFEVQVADALGNRSEPIPLLDEEDAPLTLTVDGRAPELLDEAEIVFKADGAPIEGPALFGLPGSGAGRLSFGFRVAEELPRALPAVDEPCDEACPQVRLQGRALGAVSRDPDRDDLDAGALGFRFDYDLEPEDWGAIEKDLEVGIEWSDEAGNVLDVTLPAPIRFDFVRPYVTDCGLSPDDAIIGDSLTYRVSSSERLREAPAFELSTPPGAALFEGPPEVTAGERTFTWRQPVAGLQATRVGVQVRLVDEAGNPSAGAVCAREVAVDGLAPEVEILSVAVDPPVAGPGGAALLRLGAGDTLLVALRVREAQGVAEGSPAVSLGAPDELPLSLASAEAQPEGWTRYEAAVTLDPTSQSLSSGGWPVRAQARDLLGNSWTLEDAQASMIHVDLDDPTATCGLNLPAARAGDLLRVSAVFSEPVAPASLTLTPSLAALGFELEPAQTDLGANPPRVSYALVVPGDLGELTWGYALAGRDLVGNPAASAPLCDEGDFVLDTVAPALDLVEPVDMNRARFGPESAAAPDENRLVVGFGLRERFPVSLTSVDGPCTPQEGCPSVTIDGRPLGQVHRVPWRDRPEEEIWGFGYQLDVRAADWPAEALAAALTVRWEDRAGNPADLTLPDPVRLDFEAPRALACETSPDPVHGGVALSLRVVSSEPLEQAPSLTLSSDNPALFAAPPTSSSDGRTWTWETAAEDLEDELAELEVRIVDPVGNASEGPACALEIPIDVTPPRVDAVTFATNPEIRGEAQELLWIMGPDGVFSVSLEVEEAGGIVVDGSEIVLGAPEPLTIPLTEVKPTGPTSWAVSASLTVDPELHHAQEGVWPVHATLTDAVGNTARVEGLLEDALVRLDFTAPAAECALIPDPALGPYALGQTPVLQVTLVEALAAGSRPQVAATYTPALGPDDPPFELTPSPDTAWRFTGAIEPGQGERALELRVSARDLAGNETEPEGSACAAGVLHAAIDARPPEPGEARVEIEEGDAFVSLQRPVRAGRRLRASIPLVGASDEAPEVWLGEAPMTPVERVEGDEGPTWRFERLVDGSEGSGPRALRLRAVDDAGNVFDDLLSGAAVTFDFTAPDAECFLSGDGAAAGALVRLQVSFSERIAEDAPQLVAGLPFELVEARCTEDDPGCVFEYTHRVAAGQPYAPFSYSVFASDPAGNPAPAVELCAGDGHVDGAAPTLAPGDAPTFSRRIFGREAPAGEEDNAFTFTFALAEDGPMDQLVDSGPCGVTDGCPEVRLAERTVGQVWRAPSLDRTSEGVVGYQFRYEVAPDGWGDVDRVVAVSLSWRDVAGNALDVILDESLRLDFIPPDVSYAALSLEPPAGSRVLAPTAVTEGSTLRLALTADEPLSSAPEITAARGTYAISLAAPATSDDPAYEYEVLLGGLGQGEDAQGVYHLTADLVDTAGNHAERPFEASSPLVVDTLEPAGLGAGLDDGVRLHRDPWGSQASGHAPRVAALGCPSRTAEDSAQAWDWCPDDWTSPVEVGARVLVYGAGSEDGEATCTDELLGWGIADGMRADFEVTLLADRPAVCLAQADNAGNESPAEPVRVVEWIGTLAGKTPGDDASHPARMLRRTSSARRPERDPKAGEVVMSSDAWDGAARSEDGAHLSARQASSWRLAQAAGQLPYTLSGHGLSMGPRGALMAYGGVGDEATIATHQLEWIGDRWTGASPASAPYAFHLHAMAYDPARGRTLAFGGWGTNSQYRSETWEWDGERWLQHRPELAPAPRVHAAMAYDPVSRRILLFGGAEAGPLTDGVRPLVSLGGTWTWDGAGWQELDAVGGPAGRYGHAMVTDWRRDRIVLFGGYSSQDGALLADTWAWDGEAWARVETSGAPYPRRHHGMAYDAARGRVVVFGGERTDLIGMGVLMGQDTWELDGDTWTSILWFSGPSPRAQARLGYDPAAERVVLLGGQDYLQHFRDSWTWDGETWEEVSGGQARFERYDHRLAYDASTQAPVLYSGHDGTTLDGQPNCVHDLWAWLGDDWSQVVTADLPPARLGHSLTWVGGLDLSVLLGGRGPADWRDDAWSLALGAWSELAPPLTVARRMDHAAAWDRAGGGLLVFGGEDDAGVRGDTWRYDGQVWEALAEGAGPPARDGAAMAWDGTRLLLFGGQAGASDDAPGDLLADTWAWDGDSWQALEPASSPPARRDHELIWDSDRGRLVLFGGVDADEATLVDLWEWDGEVWLAVDVVPGFIARPDQGLVYDLAAHEALLAADWTGRTWAYGPAHERPQLVVGFDLAAAHTLERSVANPGRKQLLSLSLRARARGLGHALDTGAPVAGFDIAARTVSDPPWLVLNGDLEATADAPATWSERFDAAWRCPDASCEHVALDRLVSEREGLWLLVEPRAAQGARPDPAELDLDYLEARLVYRRAPHCEPTAACCDDEGYWAATGTPCDDGLPTTTGDRCRAGQCVGALPTP